MKSGGSKLTFLTLVFLVQPSSALHSETGKRKGIGFVASVPCKIAIFKASDAEIPIFSFAGSFLFITSLYRITALYLSSPVPPYMPVARGIALPMHRSCRVPRLFRTSCSRYVSLSSCLKRAFSSLFLVPALVLGFCSRLQESPFWCFISQDFLEVLSAWTSLGISPGIFDTFLADVSSSRTFQALR